MLTLALVIRAQPVTERILAMLFGLRSVVTDVTLQRQCFYCQFAQSPCFEVVVTCDDW